MMALLLSVIPLSFSSEAPVAVSGLRNAQSAQEACVKVP